MCTTLIAVAEFYGRQELQQRLKAKLEDWWLRLAYIKVPNSGLAEAVFTAQVFESIDVSGP
jgi:hypothetical protein